ncbi:TIGR03084 family protein [Rhodococcus sp. D2-41]|uniref:TIGR03084 family metal-binding protein n=1 Tax=Speluncibacter jeojiensis TaxID=2710754 RepID=A0A9X4M1B9_9ACTN|nr:TIGR03084 family metal-binding protein [Rhodococcus sp. D2-41]MDG3009128.1 TIGR03084 family protein [Rhodococcus sp. D2-41]MDG3016200.1 TIGR03084 family metal-binding protein [Corynebacteriales bacterium D3-21]
MANLDMVLGDLAAEGEDLDGLVSSLSADGWTIPTPAQGWDIAHQIAHLAWTDHVALLSATDPDAFAAQVTLAWQNPTGFVDEAAATGATAPPDRLLDGWRTGRKALLEALRAYPAGEKLQWFGPPMSVASMATGRIMETWAHGQDVADALGVTRLPTARLKHVAHIGIRARDFSYAVHEQTPPDQQFRVELTAPDGTVWTWGPDDARQSVTGPALDFCLLVTQRRHRDDLALTATGPDATHWLTLAQAFAGGAGTGREKGQFA